MPRKRTSFGFGRRGEFEEKNKIERVLSEKGALIVVGQWRCEGID